MTIDDLLEKSVSELEAMSDEQLATYLSPYFQFCRPETNPLSKGSSKISSSIISRGPLKNTKVPSETLAKAFYEEAKKKAIQMGIKI